MIERFSICCRQFLVMLMMLLLMMFMMRSLVSRCCCWCWCWSFTGVCVCVCVCRGRGWRIKQGWRKGRFCRGGEEERGTHACHCAPRDVVALPVLWLCVCVCVYVCMSVGPTYYLRSREKECRVWCASVIVALERGHPMDTTGAKASEDKAVAGRH
jgi:hypothetical protein